MAISADFLQDLKSKCEIEDVVASYVKLKRRGSSLVGLCPFHSEKTPSFTLFPDTQSFYCFGCSAGGDVITFIRQIENLDYIEALRLLADRAGLELPEEDPEEGMTRQRRDRIYSANKEAAKFFHASLKGEAGKEALDYLIRRGISPKTITRFGLGYAPDSWDGLLKHLALEGFSDAEAREAGLAVMGRKGTVYDYFRNRVIFPIIDLRGNVIAFGGRVMDDSVPKYLNSPDTPVFKKSLNLFSLNFAKGSCRDRVILTEGYMDTIALHQAGFTNVIATLGTSLTSDQARLLSRYTAEAVIAYDADEAGKRATDRAISVLSETGVRVKVLSLEGGKDPDEFIKLYGADRFRALLEGSESHIEHMLAAPLAKYDLSKPDEKVRYINEAVAVLAGIRNPVERDVYAQSVANVAEVSKQAVLSEIEIQRRRKGKKEEGKALRAEMDGLYAKRDKVNPEKSSAIRGSRAEEGIICAVFHHPDFARFLEGRLGEDDFVTDFNRRVYTALKRIIDENALPEIILLSPYFTEAEMGSVSGMLARRENHSFSKEELLENVDALKDERRKISKEEAAGIDPRELEDYIRSKYKK